VSDIGDQLQPYGVSQRGLKLIALKTLGLGTIAASGAIAVAVTTFGPAELGLRSSESDTYLQLKRHPTWLQYLPSEPPDGRVSVATLNQNTVQGVPSRRIDLVVEGPHSGVSLCFAPSRQVLIQACPGSTVLGRSTRDIDQPWVSQMGATDLDMLALLNGAPPTLDEARSLTS